MIIEPPAVRELYRAILTLRALPDPDLHWFAIGTTWPHYVRAYLDAYEVEHDTDDRPRHIPTPADVARYLDILAWGRELSRLQWRIINYRADDYSLELIADCVRQPLGVVRMEFRLAVNWILGRAHASLH